MCWPPFHLDEPADRLSAEISLVQKAAAPVRWSAAHRLLSDFAIGAWPFTDQEDA